MADPRVSGASPISPQAMQMLQEAAQTEELQWVESDEDFEQWCDSGRFQSHGDDAPIPPPR